MTDLEHMLERQAQWQKSRQSLTWPEKIRMAERVRESVRQLRAQSLLVPVHPDMPPIMPAKALDPRAP
jgi:hypothetical protein